MKKVYYIPALSVAAVEVLLSNCMPCLYRDPFAFLYFLYQIHLMKALTVVTHYC
jgi:hypothetical protein